MDTAEQYEDEQTNDLQDLAEDEIQPDPLEEKARKMGWVPEDEFRGDKANWRPAEDFIERGERMIPILNKKIRDLEKRQNEKDQAFSKYLTDMRNKLHDQKLQDHELEKQKAVDDGDTDAYARLSNAAPVNDLPEYTPPTPQGDPVFEQWMDENAWYNDDYEKHQEAENYGSFLKRTQPHLEGRDFLDTVTNHVKQKFSNPNRNRPSAVDGGTQKASGTTENLYNTLDAEGKKMFNTFVAQGIFKNTKEDREAYAKDVLG